MRVYIGRSSMDASTWLMSLGYSAIEHPAQWRDVLAWNLALAGLLCCASDQHHFNR